MELLVKHLCPTSLNLRNIHPLSEFQRSAKTFLNTLKENPVTHGFNRKWKGGSGCARCREVISHCNSRGLMKKASDTMDLSW